MTATKCIEYVNEAIVTLIRAYEEAENQTESVVGIRLAIKALEDLKLSDFRNGGSVE